MSDEVVHVMQVCESEDLTNRFSLCDVILGFDQANPQYGGLCFYGREKIKNHVDGQPLLIGRYQYDSRIYGEMTVLALLCKLLKGSCDHVQAEIRQKDIEWMMEAMR